MVRTAPAASLPRPLAQRSEESVATDEPAQPSVPHRVREPTGQNRALMRARTDRRAPRSRMAFGCALLASVSGLTPTAASASAPPHDLLVGYTRPAAATDRAAVALLLDAQHVEPLPGLDADRISTTLPLPIAAARVAELATVAYIERNAVGRLAAAPPAAPDDPNWNGSANWRMTRANIPAGWALWPRRYFTAETKPLVPITVAILDGWIDVTHRDFKNKGGSQVASRHGGQLLLSDRAAFVPADQQRGPFDWHGTFIAGIVGGAANNGRDVAGIAYGEQLLPIIVADGNGRVTAADAAAGIMRAVQRDARVLNLSFAIAAGDGSATLRRAVERAGRAGALIVAAAGNDANDAPLLPAAFARTYDNVIAVSATTVLDALAPCSSFGRHVTLSAPGTDVVSLKPGGGTMFAACGTSAATAMVSGAAAVIASAIPGASPAAIRGRLERSADDIAAPGRDVQTGAGRLNLGAALGEPRAATVTVTRPRAVGASERVTIIARATGMSAIHGAELAVDPITRPRSIPMRARDGSLDARTEVVLAELATGSLAEGVHDLAVRAKDGRGRWGPASIVPLVVDRHAPSIPILETDPPVVVPGDPGTTLQLTVLDQLSRTVDVTLEFIDANDIVQARYRYDLPPGAYRAAWRGTRDRPGGTRFTGDALPPGRYVIRATALDEAGLKTVAEGSCIIAVDPRI